jgi:rubrerythrin
MGEKMVSKSDAQELASQAIDMGAGALRGFLHRGEAEEWIVGSTNVNTWLGRYEGFELILLALPVGEQGTAEMRTCRTCGREYEGDVCPHCQTARKRLRGE